MTNTKSILHLKDSEIMENPRAEKGFALARQTPNAVRKIPKLTPNMWQIWKVQSQSVRDTIYTVVEKSNGEVECDCPDFANRKDLILCKHVWACLYAEVLVTNATSSYSKSRQTKEKRSV